MSQVLNEGRSDQPMADSEPKGRKKRHDVSRRLLLGAFALVGWLGFYSAGQLVETYEYRKLLAPRMFADIEGTTTKSSPETRVFQSQSSFAVFAVQMPSRQPPEGQPQSPSVFAKLFAFIAATLSFTPTNLVFVTLFAGLLGGCASNVVEKTMADEQKARLSDQSLWYLSETPWAAMMRSFIVYLCVIAGLYFVNDDPFKNPTSAQYARMAGTLSILAFVVGYDPSRVQQWLNIVPRPQGTQMVAVRDRKTGMEAVAVQTPAAVTPNVNAQIVSGDTAERDADPTDIESDQKPSAKKKPRIHH